MVYYNQNNYGNIPYPSKSLPNATVKSGGCGVVCASIIVENLTEYSCPPSKMAGEARACGARVEGGTDMSILSKYICTEYGLTCIPSSSESELLEHLREGYAAICNVSGNTETRVGVFSTGGHYIIAVGVHEDGRVMLLDPGYYTGKYNIPYRKKYVEVQGNILLSSIDVLSADTANRVPNYYLFKGGKRMPFWRDNSHIRQYTPKNFRLLWWDAPKKTSKIKNYCNANFFCSSKVGSTIMTEPAGIVVADIDIRRFNSAIQKHIAPRVSGNKIRYGCNDTWSTQFDGKNITTLICTDEKFFISKYNVAPEGANYAVSGLPIMKNGADISWSKDVLPEGWGNGSVYATWHIVLGIAGEGKTLYRIAIKTSTSNCIKSSELYNKLKALKLGITDALLLDGGGSLIVDEEGKNVIATIENRRINCVIY